MNDNQNQNQYQKNDENKKSSDDNSSPPIIVWLPVQNRREKFRDQIFIVGSQSSDVTRFIRFAVEIVWIELLYSG